MKQRLLLFLALLLTTFGGARAQETLTVHDGTATNGNVPVYGFYADAYLKCEMVYPADELSVMAGGTINGMTFYASSPASEAWTATWQVFVAEVADATISAFSGPGTVVYEGQLDGTQSTMEITFTTPYDYGGGNLLVGVYCTVTGNYKSVTWVGDTVEGASVQGYNYNSLDAVSPAVYNFLPKTTFDYEPVGSSTCAKPENFVVSDITDTGATFTWDSEVGSYKFEYKIATATEWTAIDGVLTGATYELEELTDNTAYQARVKAVCGPESESGWKTISFTTENPCAVPANLAASEITAFSATISWTPGYGQNAWTVKYKKTADEEWTETTASGNPTITLEGLDGDTQYDVEVYNECEGSAGASIQFYTAETCPDGKVCIGTGKATSDLVPAHNFYRYSLTQQIYTAAEIGDAGYIQSIDFFKAKDIEMVKDLKIYIVATEKETFESNNDWISVTEADLAFSGTVTFGYNEWTTIELDNPFEYNGSSNIAIIVDNNTGSYKSSTGFYVFDAGQNQTLYQRSDETNLDPTADISGTSGTLLTVKNRIRLVVGETPAVAKPRALTVNYTGGTTAEVSWVSDETEFELDVNGVVTTINSSTSYTLTNLELSTTYEVKVRAKNGDDYSDWTTPVSFTTDDCMPEDQIVINYQLTDSYGDGWSGNAILVVDDECNIVEELTIVSGASNSGTLRLCSTALNFYWSKGNYPGETSWVFTDANGDPLFSGAGSTDMQTLDLLYTIDLNPYQVPSDIEVSEISGRTATVSWTENGTATAWQIMLINGENEEIIDANTNPFTLTGLDPETDYSVNVRAVGSQGTSLWPCVPSSFTTGIAYPVPTSIAANNITLTTADISWTGNDEATGYNLRYKKDVPGEEIASIDFDDSSMGEWTTIDADGDGYTWVLGSEVGDVYLVSGGTLADSGHNGSADLVCSGSYSNVSGALTPDNYLVSPQITLGGRISFYVCGQDASYAAEHFGVAVSTTGNTDPADFTTIAEWTLTANGTAASKDQGTWGQFTVDLSDYSGQGYVAIRHFNCTDQFLLDLDDIVITSPSGESWTTAENVTSPYTIEGLEGSTAYLVQVQAVYADGVSQWAQGSFTTKNPDDLPTDLAADVTATTATLSWAGVQDSYNVQYRTAEVIEEYYFNDFNAGYDAVQGEGWSWVGSIIYGIEDPVNNIPGAENYFLPLGWDTTEEATIVSPELPEYESGAVLEFHHFYYQTANTFQIGYSTTTNESDAFTWSDPIEAESSANAYTTKYSEVLPDGVKYVAFKATASTQAECIFIDNFRIYKVTAAPGEWIPATANEGTLTLTDLTPGTDYEWQVQGNLTEGTTEWSEIASFTTGAYITFAKEGYATYYNSKKDVVLPAGMKAFVVTGGKGDTHLNYVAIADGDLTAATTNLVPAGVAVMLQVAATEEDQTITVSLAKPSAVADFTGTNHLLGSDVDVEETTGLGSSSPREYFYKLNYPADGLGEFGWYWGADDGYPFASPAHKAWLVLEDDNLSSIAELPGHEGATGIQSVGKDTTTAEGWYTISGMKLDKQPTNKGLYIHNGKKVVVE